MLGESIVSDLMPEFELSDATDLDVALDPCLIRSLRAEAYRRDLPQDTQALLESAADALSVLRSWIRDIAVRGNVLFRAWLLSSDPEADPGAFEEYACEDPEADPGAFDEDVCEDVDDDAKEEVELVQDVVPAVPAQDDVLPFVPHVRR
jgi:hypothetical protein